MNIGLRTPPGFNFRSTLFSHGWCTLAPFSVDRERSSLSLVLSTPASGAGKLTMTEAGEGRLSVDIEGWEGNAARAEAKTIVRSILRMDEDLSHMHAVARKDPRFRWVAKIGAGRMLRSSTAFEDVVKMICTTNCSWGLTQVMVRNLCERLGTRIDGAYSFPEPEALAKTTERFVRQHIRAGYRAPYLIAFAKNIAEGRVDPEAWRRSSLESETLYEELRTINGVGPYAAANVLKLLGRYDYLGIDSWCRKQFATMSGKRRPPSDRSIEKAYHPYGKWRGLFFWLDLTKPWYEKAFPF